MGKVKGCTCYLLRAEDTHKQGHTGCPRGAGRCIAERPGAEPGCQPYAQGRCLLTDGVDTAGSCRWHGRPPPHPTQIPLAVGTTWGPTSADRTVRAEAGPSPLQTATTPLHCPPTGMHDFGWRLCHPRNIPCFPWCVFWERGGNTVHTAVHILGRLPGRWAAWASRVLSPKGPRALEGHPSPPPARRAAGNISGVGIRFP